MDLARRLGQRIQALRGERKLTMEQLAYTADALSSKGYLSEIEAGRRLPSLHVLADLAKRLTVEPYDLLVTIPINMGSDMISASGLGNELNYVPVDAQNFLSKDHDNIFAIGDAADLPTSKAGSVAHFAVEVFTDNFLRHIEGLDMREAFDGHANCFIESGHGKGLLIDFNYDTEPLPGKYPLPGIGPFTLLKETELNHWGKMMFKWTYWNILLRGKEMPLPHEMLMAGKIAEGA